MFCYYRQDCAQRRSSDIVLLGLIFFRFFAPQGRHVVLIKVGEIWQGEEDLWLWAVGFALVILENYEIQQFNLRGVSLVQCACAILTNFTWFMRVLRLHSSAKFSCFSSTK